MDKLKVGLIGLGPLGLHYARVIHKDIKNGDLLAVSSFVEKELDLAQQELGIKQVYSDYRELLALNELDAVFIMSSTDQHTRHIIEGIEAGLHIFSAKPMATNVEDAKKVLNLANKMQSQSTVVSFVRRYDESYKYAEEQLRKGTIGQPCAIRSQTIEKDLGKEYHKNISRKNGGIFMELNVDDIDLARWYLQSEFKKVYAIGRAFKYDSYDESNDADYVQCLCQMENDSIANISASRIASYGYDNYTEIIGTEGTLRIGRPPLKNNVEIYDRHGVLRECVQDFYGRFEKAIYNQASEFIDQTLKGNKLKYRLNNAVEATRVAVAMTKSFLLNKEVTIER